MTPGMRYPFTQVLLVATAILFSATIATAQEPTVYLSVAVQQIDFTAPQPPPARPSRPKMLLPLYVSAGALQVFDIYTTSRGLKAGGVETNDAIRKGNSATTIALKAGTTAAGILIAEKMWKKNRAAAVTAMVVTNVIGAVVVANNYHVIRQLEGR